MKFATQIVSVIVLSRILLPADFGTMAMISPLVASIGFPRAGPIQSDRQCADDHAFSAQHALWINATMSAALAALVAACAPLMGIFYHQESVIGPTLAMREFLHFGKGITGFDVANFFTRNLDNVLIGKFAGSTELGFYDRAYKLLLFPLQQVNAPVAQVLTPVLSRLADGSRAIPAGLCRHPVDAVWRPFQ